MPKVKGTGGFGQWDTGTANQDIRASVPRSPSRNSGSYVGPNVVTQQDIAQGQRIIARRDAAARKNKRSTTRGKRR